MANRILLVFDSWRPRRRFRCLRLEVRAITCSSFFSLAHLWESLALSAFSELSASHTLAGRVRCPSFPAFGSESAVPTLHQLSLKKIRPHVISDPQQSCECRRSRKRSNGTSCQKDELPDRPLEGRT